MQYRRSPKAGLLLFAILFAVASSRRLPPPSSTALSPPSPSPASPSYPLRATSDNSTDNSTSDNSTSAITSSNTTSHAHHAQAVGASSDCTAAFSGGPTSALDSGAQLAIKILSFLPVIGNVAKYMNDAAGYLKPSAVIDGRSIYDCISGFVEEAIDRKINEYDLRQVNFHLGYITGTYKTFQNLVQQAPSPMTDVYQRSLASAFHDTDSHTDLMGAYFTDAQNGVRDPAGALPAFATFVTTQHLPLLYLEYANYDAIYGGKPSETAALRAMVVVRSQQALNDSQAFYNRTFSAMLTARTSKISQPEHWQQCHCGGASVRSLCCSEGFRFKDGDTEYSNHERAWGAVHNTSGNTGGNTSNTSSNSDTSSNSTSALTSSNELKYFIDGMRRLVVDRAESSSRINIYQSTSSRPTRPLLLASPTATKLKLQHRVVVTRNLCFSNSVDCTGDGAGMPAGHNYRDFNISAIDIRSGAWIDWIGVTYTHRTSGQQLFQKFGNTDGGGVCGPPQNLFINPITKITWASQEEEGYVVKDLWGFTLEQAGGQATTAGTFDGAKQLVDNYSVWKGAVWLCGMNIHGEAGGRVAGIGPHWCYNEAYTA